MGDLLRVQDLKMYIYAKRGVVKAVDGVSFSVREGETLGLVGESGCGKTMTCLSLLKLQPQPGGRIVGGQLILDGEDLVPKTESEMRKVRGRKISMILQDPLTSLNPAFTIGDQVAEAIMIHERTDKRHLWEKVIEVLRSVRVPAAEKRLDDFPYQMSGGMRQRVSGAIAISAHPRLLIADEPTTALDVSIQAQYLRLLKEIQARSGLAMLFVTHDLGVVAAMCDKAAVMYAGRIIEQAGVRELFDNPRHPYTAALLQCLPRIEAKRQKLANIQGEPPDMGALPLGCSFAARCTRAIDICTKEPPREVPLGDGHYARCWLVEQ